MEKSVEKLAALFNQTPDVVKEAIEKDELGGVIDPFLEQTQMFSSDELQKKLDNHAREVIAKLGTDGKPIPSNIYNHVKGNAFEKAEKDLAKKYEVEEWEGLDDLVDKISAKSSTGKDEGEKVKELADQIMKLKDLVKKSEEEKTEAIKTKEIEFSNELIKRDTDRAVKMIPINADGEELANRRLILETMFRREYGLEYKDGRTIVLKNGEVVTNKVGDPVPLEEVMTDFAPKWVDVKDVPSGGRGGSSTGDSKDKGPKGINSLPEFLAYCEKEGIKEGSKEMFALKMQLRKDNPDINF